MDENTVPVIALEAFTDDQDVEHHYGEEFTEPKGARLDEWVKSGKVRVDDRAAKRPAAPKGKAGA